MAQTALWTAAARSPASVWSPWRAAAFGAGAALVGLLMFVPETGLTLFWNLVVPAVPAMAAFAPGIWRNVCPLATASMGAGMKPVSPRIQGRFLAIAVAALLLLIPMRRVILDSNGPATALVLIGAAVLAAAIGRRMSAKAGWCASLCPVGAVERLYGSAPAVVVRNAQCTACSKCVTRCPDTSADPIRTATPPGAGRVAMMILAGAFPGFVWGWFQAPDGSAWGVAYGMPAAGGAVTLALFLLLGRIVPSRPLVRGFAATALMVYYWFRLPALIGLGIFPGEGMLLDLTPWAGERTVAAMRLAVVAGLAWWFLAPQRIRRPWSIRPPYRGGTGLNSA